MNGITFIWSRWDSGPSLVGVVAFLAFGNSAVAGTAIIITPTTPREKP